MSTIEAPRTSIPAVDARIARAAVSGFPLVTRAALRLANVDWKAIERRISDGRLRVLWEPILMIGIDASEIAPDHVCAAAVSIVGPHGALDGASALERRRLWDRHDGTIEVTSDRGHAPIRFRVPVPWRASKPWNKRRRVLEIRFTRSSGVAGAAVDLLDGVRTRTALDALLRAAIRLTPHQLAYVIKRCEYEGEFSLDDLDRALDRRKGERGTRALRRAVALRRSGCAGTKSRSEDVVLPHVSDMYGEPLVNVRGIAGIPTHEPDFCWPERRWILEVDGRHHFEDPVQREADLRTDAILRAAGWIVVRIPWYRVWNDMPGVLAEIRVAFGTPAR